MSILFFYLFMHVVHDLNILYNCDKRSIYLNDNDRYKNIDLFSLGITFNIISNDLISHGIGICVYMYIQ